MDFQPLHHTLDALYCDLHKQGIEAVRHQAANYLKKTKSHWSSGVVDADYGESLLNAVSFTMDCT